MTRTLDENDYYLKESELIEKINRLKLDLYKERNWKSNKYLKSCLISLIIRQICSKITNECNWTPRRLEKNCDVWYAI